MAVDISNVIRIDTRVAAAGTPRRDFGVGLLITTDDSIPAGGSGKGRLYASLAAMQEDFDAGDALTAATVWFSADPPPKSLLVGRWASADVATTLRGGTPAGLTDVALNASNAAFDLAGNDVTVDLSPAAIDTYAEIAAAVQSAIVALGGIFTGATFTFDNGAFLLTLAGAAEITGGAFGSPSTGTDASAALGMAASSNPTYHPGHDQETVEAAVREIVLGASANLPVVLFTDDGVPAVVGAANTVDSLRAYAQANDYVFIFADTSDQALVANDATSPLALAFAAQQSQVAGLYSMPGTRPDIALAALMSSQNLNNRASVITPHSKPLPGSLPSNLTDAQYAELVRKRANVYDTVLGLPSFLGGYTSRPGHWLDSVWWLLWFKDRLDRAIWGAARGSRRLTNALMLDALTRVAEAGVNNGGLAPGRSLTAANRADVIATTGNDDFDGVLTAGYLIWVDTNPDADDIEDRIGTFKLWGTGSPAIHRVNGDVVFQN